MEDGRSPTASPLIVIPSEQKDKVVGFYGHRDSLIDYTISKSKRYIQSATCNELHYYKLSVVVTYGLRIGIRICWICQSSRSGLDLEQNASLFLKLAYQCANRL